MARVTEAEVEEIIDVDSSVDVAPFIAVATALVDKLFLGDPDCVLGAAILKEIERWLTAHFLAVSSKARQTVSEKDGEAAETFQSSVGPGGLAASHYGKQAMILDCCGKLAAADKGRTPVTFESLVPIGQLPDNATS